MLCLASVSSPSPRMDNRFILNMKRWFYESQSSMQVSSDKSYRAARLVLVSLVLLSALCAGLHTVGDSDMGWHLATGRWVVEHGQVPRTECFRFLPRHALDVSTVRGRAALPHIYRIWLRRFELVCALACLAVVRTWFAVETWGAPCCAACGGSIAARTLRGGPFQHGFLCSFSWRTLGLSPRSALPLWLLPGIMLLWVNLHPGFIAGLGHRSLPADGVLRFCVCGAARGGALTVTAGMALARAGGAVTLVNPWGPRIYAAALNMAGAAGSSQERSMATTRLASSWAYPYQPIVVSALDVRHAQFGFTWLLLLAAILAAILFWKRQAGAGLLWLCTLCRIESCAVFGAVRNLRRNFGCGSAGGTLRRAPGWLCKNNSPHVLRVPTSAAILLTAVFCAIALLRIADLSRTALTSCSIPI